MNCAQTRSAFIARVNCYLDQTFRERIGRLEPSLPPREAIVALLQEVVKRSLTDKQRRGCMLVNSAIERAPHDAKLFDIVAIFLDEVERFFLRCVSNGQKDGTITKAYSAADPSRSLLGALLGIRVLARVRPERKLLEGLLRPIFGLLDDTLSIRRRGKRAGSATS